VGEIKVILKNVRNFNSPKEKHIIDDSNDDELRYDAEGNYYIVKNSEKEIDR
jgi:hypothetical protein